MTTFKLVVVMKQENTQVKARKLTKRMNQKDSVVPTFSSLYLQMSFVNHHK